MKYKLKDIVQTTASTSPPRRVGEITYVSPLSTYEVEFLDGTRYWYSESELRPYKKKSERVKPATREEEKKEKQILTCHRTCDMQGYLDKHLHEEEKIRVVEHLPKHTCEWRFLRSLSKFEASREELHEVKVIGSIDIFYCIFNPEHRREV